MFRKKSEKHHEPPSSQVASPVGYENDVSMDQQRVIDEESTTNPKQKKENIFRKLTKRKRRDEKCESNPNTKPMLILTFALCLIVMVAGGSVKMK